MNKVTSLVLTLVAAFILVACGSKETESPDAKAAEVEVNVSTEVAQENKEQNTQCEHNWCPATAYWNGEYMNGTIQRSAENEYVCSICGQRAIIDDEYFKDKSEENTEPPVSTPNPNHEWRAIEEPYLCADGNQVNIVVGYTCDLCGMIWYAPEEALLPPDVDGDHVHDWRPKKTGYNTNFYDCYMCKICGILDRGHSPNYGIITPPTYLIDEEILVSTNRFAGS